MGNVAVRLKELLREKANQLDVDIEALEIMPDHVHLFVSSDPTAALTFTAGTPVNVYAQVQDTNGAAITLTSGST